MSSFCRFEKDNRIFRLELTGDSHHYLTEEGLGDLRGMLADIRKEAASGNFHGLITTSSAGSFCDGIDNDGLKRRGGDPAAQAKVLSDGLAAVIKELMEMPMLTVCAAAGNASSLGLALALAHDDLVVLSDAQYWLGMVEDGYAVQPYVGALIREKTDGWYTKTTLKSRRRDGSWMKSWYFADSKGSNPDDVLGEAKKLVKEWTGRDGQVHAQMRKRLYRESWNAVSTAVP